MEAISLILPDIALLAARYSEHGNSHRRMSQALREAGAASTVERLHGLRSLEHRFDIDLGLLCHWYFRRDAVDLHPIARSIIQYVTRYAARPAGAAGRAEVWILIDRLRQLRSYLDEGRLVGEPES